MSRRPGPADEPPELPEGEVLLLDPARDLWRPRPRRVLLALVVVGGLTSVGVWFAVRPSPDERARDLLHLARTELAASHPDQAGPLLAEALRHDPRNAEAHYLSGVAAVLGGRPADAEAAFREALALRPRHVAAGTALARILSGRGEIDGALALLDRAVEVAGPDSAPFAARAEARLDSGDLGGALEDLVASLERGRDPDAGVRCLLAGHLADFLGRTTWSEALVRTSEDLYRRVPGLQPRRGESPGLAVAESQVAAGRSRTALTLLESEPPQPLVAVLRAEALRLDGSPTDAENVLRTEIAREDSPAPRAALARLLAGDGRVRAAALEIEDARRLFPDDAGVLHAAAFVGRAAATGADPSDLVAALLRTAPGTYNAAEPLLADRVLRSPVGPLATRAALALRGVAALSGSAAATDAARDADARIDTILARDADDAYARMWRGAIRLRRGDADGARDDLDVAVARGAAGGRERLLRALALGATGRWGDALDDVRAAVGTVPPDPVSAAVEVRVWLGLDDRGAALDLARRAAARWPADLYVARQLRDALAPVPGAVAEPASAREREWIETRLRLASLDPRAVRETVRSLADDAARDEVSATALAGFWDDIAAEWAERERKDPRDARAPLAHATSLVRAGRPRRAEDVLRRAAERMPAAPLVSARARILVRMGAYDAAEAALRPILEASPGDLRLELEMASIRMARGDRAAGLAALRRALASPEARPDVQADAAIALVSDEVVEASDADAVLVWSRSPAARGLEAGTLRLIEGLAQLALGKTDAAVAAGEEVLRTQPGRSRAAVLTARGWLVEGRPEKAEEVLARAGADAPGDPVVAALSSHVRLVLGLRAFDAGDRAAAAGWWEAAFTGSDLDYLAATALADLQIRSGDVGASSSIAARLGARRLGSAAVSLFRGRCEETRGRPAVARADLLEAVARAPAHVATVSAFVTSAVAAGDLEAAERACRRAIDAGDRLGLVHAILAFVLDRRGDRDGAERAWRATLARDPANFGAVASLTDLLIRGGRADEARVLVAGVRPDAIPAPGEQERFERLRAYVETGPVAGAIDRLREVLSGRPSDTGSAAALGRALAATGDVAGALPWFESAAASAPAAIEPRALLVRALAVLGRLDEAETRLLDRVRGEPADAGSWCLLGMIASERTRPDAAEQYYRRALAASATDALAINNLACIVFDQPGRRKEAHDLIARAAHDRPEVPHLAATRGWLLLRDGNASAALSVLDEAAARHPSFAPARLHRAEAYLALGRRESAAAEFREAERLDPSVAGRASAALRELSER